MIASLAHNASAFKLFSFENWKIYQKATFESIRSETSNSLLPIKSTAFLWDYHRFNLYAGYWVNSIDAENDIFWALKSWTTTSNSHLKPTRFHHPSLIFRLNLCARSLMSATHSSCSDWKPAFGLVRIVVVFSGDLIFFGLFAPPTVWKLCNGQSPFTDVCVCLQVLVIERVCLQVWSDWTVMNGSQTKWMVGSSSSKYRLFSTKSTSLTHSLSSVSPKQQKSTAREEARGHARRSIEKGPAHHRLKIGR